MRIWERRLWKVKKIKWGYEKEDYEKWKKLDATIKYNGHGIKWLKLNQKL